MELSSDRIVLGWIENGAPSAPSADADKTRLKVSYREMEIAISHHPNESPAASFVIAFLRESLTMIQP